MTNEQILDQQVEALEKLLQLKQAVIEELESKIRKMEAEKFAGTPAWPYIGNPALGGGGITSTPYVQPLFIGGGVLGSGVISGTTIVSTCPDGTQHNFLNGSAITNTCKKCGQYNISTYSTNTLAVNTTAESDGSSGDCVLTLAGHTK